MANDCTSSPHLVGDLFHVGQQRLACGTRLRRYHMSQHSDLVGLALRAIERGPEAVLVALGGALGNSAKDRADGSPLNCRELKMMIVLEAVFEMARKELASMAPVRLDCVFAWPTLEHAKSFKSDYLPSGIIHACKIVSGSSYIRDGAMLPPGIDVGTDDPQLMACELEQARLRAGRYWQANDSMELPEVMVSGEVVVTSTIPAL